jgi:hypothetical protein
MKIKPVKPNKEEMARARKRLSQLFKLDEKTGVYNFWVESKIEIVEEIFQNCPTPMLASLVADKMEEMCLEYNRKLGEVINELKEMSRSISGVTIIW